MAARHSRTPCRGVLQSAANLLMAMIAGGNHTLIHIGRPLARNARPYTRTPSFLCRGVLQYVGAAIGRPPAPKETATHPGGRLFWSRVRESNPPSRLGKPLYYRYTNPASGGHYTRPPCKIQGYFSDKAECTGHGWALPVERKRRTPSPAWRTS